MERVLFKREWRTPLGRFRKSLDGVPTEVPSRVLQRYQLPSDAVIVPESYIPPLLREETDDESTGMTSAQQEALIQQRVNAEIAMREAKARGDKAEGVAKKADEILDKELADILKGDVAAVKKALGEVKVISEFEELLSLEQNGGARKGVIVYIEAALEDLREADESFAA